MRSTLLAVSFALPSVVAAATPTPADFARGYLLVPEPGRPLQELALPDGVYAGVTRADLGDLRVFNAGGIVVPHALCPGPQMPPPEKGEASLPVFSLDRARASRDSGAGTRVEIETRGGTEVRIQEPAAGAVTAAPATETAAYVIDASAVEDPIHAIRVFWETADGASELRVRVEASEDLDRWTTAVSATTLLRIRGPQGTLERFRIPLPARAYRYLRLTRAGDGPQPVVSEIMAEWTRAAPQPEPFLFTAQPDARHDGHFWFDAGRLAPVHRAWIRLPVQNMTLRAALDSRAAPEAPWQQRWTGETHSMAAPVEDGRHSHADFTPVSERYWRVRIVRGRESLGQGRLRLDLGYHPARARFLVQGEGPFTLAYGSARVPPAEVQSCSQMSEGFGSPLHSILGQAAASVAPAGRFGGPDVLEPPPKPTPVRLIVLWAVLIAATLVLIAMAVSLLKRLRKANLP